CRSSMAWPALHQGRVWESHSTMRGLRLSSRSHDQTTRRRQYALYGGNMPVAATKGSKRSCDTIITNGVVITVDSKRRVFERGAVAISGRRIAAVGPMDEITGAWHGRRMLDARGGIVHPGFIDAHNHIVHTTCRGILDLPQEYPTKVSFADWKADVTSEDEH